MGEPSIVMALGLGLGLGAGGVWVVSGFGLFIPLFHFLAMPHWGRPGRLGAFAQACAMAATAAVLPGGSVLGAWAVVAERRRRAKVGPEG